MDGKHMDAVFELPRELETLLHDAILKTARDKQRVSFRPGGGVDLQLQERTKKKIARAITVLRDEYGVPDALLQDALAYTNNWEDALLYLALQYSSDALPVKVRAKPVEKTEEKADPETSGSLDVVVSASSATAASAEVVFKASDEPALNWEDDVVESDEETTKATETNTRQSHEAVIEEVDDRKGAEEAVSWTQQYLLKLAEEEKQERLKDESEEQLTPEERRFKELEDEYTMLLQTIDEMRAAKKYSKKKQKEYSQELQRRRFELVQLGWQEDQYHKKRQSVDKNKASANSDEGNDRNGGQRHQKKGEETTAEDRPDEQNDEDYSGGLFDLAASAPITVKSETSTTKTSAPPVLASFPSPPAAWTGKTPRDLLQDYCLKHKLQRPHYKKLSNGRTVHLFSIVLDSRGTLGKQEFTAPKDLHPVAGGFRSMNEAKDAIATVALFALTPNVTLYNLMPPPYRALWLSWEKERDEVAAASTNATKREFDVFVDDILKKIPEELRKATSLKAPSTTTNVEPKPAAETEPKEVEVLDSWDMEDWDADYSDEEATAALSEDSQAPNEPSVVKKEPVVMTEEEKAVSASLKDVFLRNAGGKRAQGVLKTRNNLPIASFKAQVLEALEQHNVILVSGETGCGKSTQVPQYLLEDVLVSQEIGAHCQIVCTQPRRLAAISLAERVSYELGETTTGQGDSLCGFQIRLESRMSRNTRLLFCTTGILMRKLQDPSTLEEELSHIIVDEVHERGVQNDVLLSMLRTFLESKNHLRKRPLKVILMSATLNASSFQRYFGGEQRCPMLQVPGRTFPVQEFYLEDALERTQFVLEEDSPCFLREEGPSSSSQSTTVTISGRGGTSHSQRITWDTESGGSQASKARLRQLEQTIEDADAYSDRTWRTLTRLDESVINYDLIEQLLEYLVTDSDALKLNGRTKSASVLVFLPGLQEISTLLDILAGNRVLRDTNRFELLALHSSLSPEDQHRIFDMRPGVIRIIATTNIAETSLTIEDVKVVLDSGRAKEMRHYAATKTNMLEEIWVARANAKQRLGRAGRTSGGICYRLFSRSTFKYDMSAQPLPEILRAPLTSLCLQIKTFGVEVTCAEFLRGCLDPPELKTIDDALRELYEIGALEVQAESGEEKLTPLGSHLARLPVDAKVGKLLLFGAIFGEFDAASTCAAILETKSPFVAPYGYLREMQTARQNFAVGASDLLTDVNAFNAWRQQFILSKQKPRKQDEVAFCRQHYLSRRALSEILKLKKQFHGIVAQLGFLPPTANATSLSRQSCAVLATLLYAAMEPNVMTIDRALSNSRRITLRDGDGTTALVHPGSINAKTTIFPSAFFTFPYKLHTSSIYLPTSSIVLPTALCLFSFAMEIVFPQSRSDDDSGLVSVRLNEWMPLQASLRSAILFQELRDRVQAFITQRIESPPYSVEKTEQIDEEADSKTLLSALRQLLEQEYDARDAKGTLTKQLYGAMIKA
ncbi:hypothetical protein Poli38472_002108 [Pythium oligandrum]|uniref:RNA helicase n=1 Tax=Pythium oligandrum TaxID=41045 RepID=A0A8K1FKT9_PYTOL|nr:hypothetical protein Poli38472_002108 [Pythium oligandrum]|eukprot:TMW63167.1 hypothetical protein Poli38472_002108 [Pythium oligandrum]